MNVHIIRDNKFSEENYIEVIELLNHSNGPLKFKFSTEEIVLNEINTEDDVLKEDKFKKKDEYRSQASEFFSDSIQYSKVEFPVKRKVADVHTILDSCQNYRSGHDIGNEEFVILLTEQANDLNWFSFGDEKNNAFVHTSDWGFFIGCNSAYPIAYEVLSNIFYLILFEGITDMNMHIHQDSRGCMNDFCENKSDIKLKMRTADICSACQNLMIKRQFPMSVSTQMFEIMEHLRKKLISLERFVRFRGASRIEFRGHMRRMFLVDLEKLEIKLTPLEKTVYHLFMNHPEGIKANCVSDVEKELRELYSVFFNGNNMALFNNSLTKLCDYLDPSMQEKLSSIKRKFTNAVGSNMAEYYIIKKDESDDRYKIKIDRNLVKFRRSWL